MFDEDDIQTSVCKHCGRKNELYYELVKMKKDSYEKEQALLLEK
jgi:hypothetical protein